MDRAFTMPARPAVPVSTPMTYAASSMPMSPFFSAMPPTAMAYPQFAVSPMMPPAGVVPYTMSPLQAIHPPHLAYGAVPPEMPPSSLNSLSDVVNHFLVNTLSETERPRPKDDGGLSTLGVAAPSPDRKALRATVPNLQGRLPVPTTKAFASRASSNPFDEADELLGPPGSPRGPQTPGSGSYITPPSSNPHSRISASGLASNDSSAANSPLPSYTSASVSASATSSRRPLRQPVGASPFTNSTSNTSISSATSSGRSSWGTWNGKMTDQEREIYSSDQKPDAQPEPGHSQRGSLPSVSRGGSRVASDESVSDGVLDKSSRNVSQPASPRPDSARHANTNEGSAKDLEDKAKAIEKDIALTKAQTRVAAHESQLEQKELRKKIENLEVQLSQAVAERDTVVANAKAEAVELKLKLQDAEQHLAAENDKTRALLSEVQAEQKDYERKLKVVQERLAAMERSRPLQLQPFQEKIAELRKSLGLLAAQRSSRFHDLEVEREKAVSIVCDFVHEFGLEADIQRKLALALPCSAPPSDPWGDSGTISLQIDLLKELRPGREPTSS